MGPMHPWWYMGRQHQFNRHGDLRLSQHLMAQRAPSINAQRSGVTTPRSLLSRAGDRLVAVLGLDIQLAEGVAVREIWVAFCLLFR